MLAAREECPDEPLVVFEPAGRQHDTAAGARLERPVRPFDSGASHPASADQQPHPATPDLRVHAAVETTPQQPPDQRLACAAFVAELAPVKLFPGTPSGAFRPSDDSLMVISPVSCQPTVTRCAQSPRSANGNNVHSSDRPSVSARMLRVVIAHAAQRFELDRTVVLQPRGDLGGSVDVSFHQRLLH